MTECKVDSAHLYRQYLQRLASDSSLAALEGRFIPRRLCASAEGNDFLTADDAFATMRRFVLLGPPACGKTSQLRYWLTRTARELLGAQREPEGGPLPLFIDLTQFREGFELDNLVEVALIAQGLYTSPEQRKALLAQTVPLLLVDNLDRVRDVRILQAAARLWQPTSEGHSPAWPAPLASEPQRQVERSAGTDWTVHSGPMRSGTTASYPSVVLTCRSEALSAYGGWLQGLPLAALTPIDNATMTEYLLAQLGGEASAAVPDTTVTYWLWRDAALEGLAGQPMLLRAALDAAQHGDLSRAAVVERGMQRALKFALPRGVEVGKQALACLAWTMRQDCQNSLPLAQAKETLAQRGLGVSLETLLNSGLLVAEGEGKRVCFAHPLLRAHSEAWCWQERISQGMPLSEVLGSLAPGGRDVLLCLFQLSSDRPEFLRALLALQGGPRWVADFLNREVDGAHAAKWVKSLLDGNVPATTCFHLGRSLMQVGQVEAGRLALQEALHQYRTDDAPPPLQGLDQGDEELALAWSEIVRERWQGLITRTLSQTEAALESFHKARHRVRLLYGEMWYQLGQVQMARGDFEAAIPLLQKALLLRPECGYWHHQMAVAYNRAGKAPVRSLTSSPPGPSPGQRDGEASMAERALAELQRAEELGEDADGLQGELAQAYQAQGQWDRALSAYQRARSLEPHNPLYHRQAAILLSQQGMLEDAVTAWRRALAWDPEDAAGHDALGQLYQQSSHPRRALFHFSEAVRLDPSQAPYHFHLGQCQAALKGWAQAGEHLGRAVRLEPGQAAWREALAGVLEHQGLDAEAVEHYRAAVGLRPQEAACHLALGRVLRRLGQADEALPCLKQALALQPDDPGILGELAQTHEDLGQEEEAIAAYQRACELNSSQPAPRCALARAYLRRGDLIRAQGELRLAVRLDPTDVEALTELSAVYEKTGHLQDALEALDTAIGSATCAEQGAHCHLRAGKLALRLGRAEKGRGHLEEAARLAPDEPEAHYWLGRACQEQRELPRAAEEHRRAIQLESEEASYHAALGEVTLELGILDEAHAETARAIDLRPDEAASHAQLGLIERRSGNPSVAQQHYQQAVTLDPERSDYHLALAQLYKAEGRLEKSRNHLETALAAEPKRADLHLAWGELHAEAGDIEEALASFARAVELNPDEAECLDAYGKCLMQAGHHEAAVRQLQRAADREPERGAIHLNLARALEELDRSDEALRAYARAAELLSDDRLAEALYRLGQLALTTEHIPQATKALQQVVQMRPEWAEACHSLSLALAEDGQDLSEALLHAREAAQLERDNGNYLLHVSVLCNRLGLHDDAISALESCLTLPSAPTPEVYFELGRAFEAKGDEWWREAAEEYRHAVDLAPEDPDYQHHLGILLARRNEPGAIEFLRNAVRLKPVDGDAHHYLGKTCLEEGLWAEAEHHCQKATELDPENSDYAYGLAQVLHQGGRHQEALEVLGEWAQESAEAALLKGRCSQALGDLEGALSAYERASAQSPRHAGSWHQQGSVLLALGRPEEAVQALKQGLELAEDGSDRALQSALHRQLGKAWKELTQPGRALMHLQRVVGLNGEDAETYYLLGSLLAGQGESAAAIGALRQAVDLEPTLAEAHFLLGQLYEERGSPSDRDRALVSYSQATRHAPQEIGYLKGRARLLCVQGRAEEAIPVLHSALAMDPQDAATRYHLGTAEQALGHLEEARKAYESAVALAPDEAAFLEAKAVLQRQWLERRSQAAEPVSESDYQEVTSLWQRIIELRGGESPLIRRERGLLAALFGRDEKAAEDLDQALELVPDDASLRRHRAQVLQRLERYQEALAELKAAADLEPEEATNQHLLAQCYLALGRDQEAAQALQRAIELAPSQEAAYQHALAESLARMGNVESAAATLERALNLEPDHASWHHWLGELRSRLGRHSEALDCYRRAQELNPSEPLYQHDLAEGLARTGCLNEAAQSLARALDLAPDRSEWLVELGRLYEQLGRYVLAHERYRQAAELQEDEPGYLVHLGRAAYLVGQEEDARRALARAIELAEDWAPAFEALGDFHSYHGRHREAVEAYLQATSLGEENSDYHFKLGRALHQAGECEQAVDYLERAAGLDPHRADIYTELGEVYQYLERYDEAMQAYQQAVVIAPSKAEALYPLAHLCRELGYLDQAQTHLQSLAALHPDEAAIYARLGAVCADKGAYEAALRYYLAAIERDPKEASHHYQVGLIYKQLREYKKAGHYFRQTVKLDPNNRDAYKQFAAVSALNFLGQ